MHPALNTSPATGIGFAGTTADQIKDNKGKITQCLKITQNVAHLAFSTNFCPIKRDLTGNTV